METGVREKFVQIRSNIVPWQQQLINGCSLLMIKKNALKQGVLYWKNQGKLTPTPPVTLISCEHDGWIFIPI